MKTPSEKYLVQAKKLSTDQAERLFSRMGNKLERRLDDKRLVAIEALALQLEKEDEDLNEWRKQFAEIKDYYFKEIGKAKR